jgi:hypothetical protein
MTIERAEQAFAHARMQDPEDALYVLFEGLDELTAGLRAEIADLKRQIDELKAGSSPD